MHSLSACFPLFYLRAEPPVRDEDLFPGGEDDVADRGHEGAAVDEPVRGSERRAYDLGDAIGHPRI